MPDLTARIAATLLPHFHYPDDDANWDAAVHAAEAVVRMLETEGEYRTERVYAGREPSYSIRFLAIPCPLEPSPPATGDIGKPPSSGPPYNDQGIPL